MPSKLTKAIGAVKDQTSISLAKVASSTNLEVAILKATRHENVPTDERYINEVVELVSSDKTYAKSCARAIGKRIGRTRNWIVALKSLMLVLRIFQDGDPYFPREVLHAMRRGAKILNLTNFRNDSNSSPGDYTAFMRTFALYLDERLDCFLTGKLQRRYTFKDRERGGHRGHQRHNEAIRDMKPPMMLDRITFWQRLLDRAIATSPSGVARTNRLVLISLYAIVQESFDLYKDISDGLTLLLDSFFHLQYNLCIGAFEACVKASKQHKELIEYYSYCQNLGVGRTSEYPSVQTISQELIETLQAFLKDQSSFPAVAKSPQMLALPAPPTSNSSQHGSYDSYGGQSEFSEFSTSRFSEGVSDFGSHCTSLEELMNATDTVPRQGISIDLEAYNTDQFDSHTPRDENIRTSDAGSTHSLPALNAMADLLSLDDWPEQTQESTSEQHQPQLSSASSWDLMLAEAILQPTDQLDPNESNTFNTFPQQEQNGQETNSENNWELVLAETRTQPIQQMQDINFSLDNLYNQSAALRPENQASLQLEPDKPNTFDPFPEPEHINGQEMNSGQGWELVLADTATQPSQQQPDFTASVDNLYNQQATTSTITYNPFLEEAGESAIVPSVADPTTTSTSPANFEPDFQNNDAISEAPTFQATTSAYTKPTFQAATTTFYAQNPNENDPFSDLATEQMFNGSMNEQNLLHEQQSWL